MLEILDHDHDQTRLDPLIYYIIHLAWLAVVV